MGFHKEEWRRIQTAFMYAERNGYKVIFPLKEENISKDDILKFCCQNKLIPSHMYSWSGHSNCIGCVRGGKNYWLAVHDNEPIIFDKFVKLEKRFNSTIIPNMSLDELIKKRDKVRHFNTVSIDIGTCDCGN